MKKFYIFNNIAKAFILLVFTAFTGVKANAQIDLGISLSIQVAPPELPVYVQPECPGDDYIWTPGYWAYTSGDYYWVPGVWVTAPQPGYLWTPNYWGYDGGYYRYHAGYWGEHIGFYGGINYGFGYGGSGYGGGRWDGGHFRYNTAVSNVNINIVHNTYIDRTVIVNVSAHTSFNGRGGVVASPRPEEQQAMNEHHLQATASQSSHMQTASRDKSQFASVNHGKPAVAAMNKVGGARYTAQGHAAPRVNAPAVAAHPAAVHTTAAAARPAAQPNRPVNNAAVKHTAPVNKAPQPQHAAPVTHAPQPKRAAPATHAVQPQRAAPVAHAPQPQHTAPRQQVAKSKPPVEKHK